MASRPDVYLLSAATLASFAAGFVVALAAKPKPVAESEVAAAPVAAVPVHADAEQSKADDPTFQKRILPFINAYCLPCHTMEKAAGGLVLEGYTTDAQARKARKDWQAVQHVLTAGEMPPKKHKAQPSKDDREFVVNWIEKSLTKVDCTGPKDPGRVTLRRLNRAEYNNTVRDLCGVDFKPADDFPADDVGYGFDNIGDVLSFQPILLEKYMTAADAVLDKALTLPVVPKKDTQQRRPQQISAIPRNAKSKATVNGREIDKITFSSEGSAFLPEQYNFPAEGDYIIRFRGWGTNVGGEYPKVVIRVDGKDLKTVTVDAPEGKPQTHEARGHFPEGGKRIAVAFTNEFIDKKEGKSRQFGIDLIEIEGPISPVAKPDPGSVKLLLVARPTGAADKRAAAEKVLVNFTRRAYRRPVKPEEVARLMRLFDVADGQGEPFEKAVRLPMKAVLCSPHFLYRIEDDPKDPNGVRTINDFEFATRLSYFLWSSMPDEELFRRAAANDLRGLTFANADVFRHLSDLAAEGRTFDVVVLDPPKFARNRAAVPEALKGYRRLHQLGLKLLAKD
ncbi:MAG: DUF1587 domain-containing protein, partial [Gemmataceae bacterium]|nr:DUF1587 domain-containing protein [Gemmataceae bacterium]